MNDLTLNGKTRTEENSPQGRAGVAVLLFPISDLTQLSHFGTLIPVNGVHYP